MPAALNAKRITWALLILTSVVILATLASLWVGELDLSLARAW